MGVLAEVGFLRQPVSQGDAEAITALLARLSPRAPARSAREISELLTSPHGPSGIVAARDCDARIIGMASYRIERSLMRTVIRVEDVVVAERAEGRGVGAELMRRIIGRARSVGAERVELTSNSTRDRAHRMYQRLGFKARDTVPFGLESI